MNCLPTLSAAIADRALKRYANAHLQAGMADYARGNGFEFTSSYYFLCALLNLVQHSVDGLVTRVRVDD